MATTTTETTLLRFCELLRCWRESRRPDDLSTALATIEAAALRGERDAVELMCRAIRAVAGVRVTVAMPDAPAACRMH